MSSSIDDIRAAWARRDWRATLYLTGPRVDAHALALRSHALRWCGRLEDARDAAEHALAVAATPEERADALGAQLYALMVVDHQRAQALLSTVEDRTHPGLRRIRNLVAMTRARDDGRIDDAHAAIDALEAQAAEEDDVVELAHGWSLRAEVLLRSGHSEEALHWASKAVHAVEKPGLEAIWTRFRIVHTQCVGAARRTDMVPVWLDVLATVNQHAPWSGALVRSSLATHLAELGRFDEAIEQAAEATAQARREVPNRAAMLMLGELWVHAKAGRLDTAPDIADKISNATQVRPAARRVATIAKLARPIAAGRLDEARRTLARLGEDALAFGDYPLLLQPILNLLGSGFEAAGHVAGAMAATGLALRCWSDPEELDKGRERLERLDGAQRPIPVGPHLLERRLGRGGMGEVWLAEQAAVKWLFVEDQQPSDRTAFHSEIEAVSAIAHAHVVPVFDTGRLGLAGSFCLRLPAETPYLAMAPATHTVTAELHHLSWPRAKEILEAVLDALAATHARGLLHLDVKPDNVLVAGPNLWLADFGLTSAVGDATRIAGTPAYMAPERCRGVALGVEADLYSVGCMAWEFLCGAPPFSGSPREILRHHTTSPLPPFRPRFDVPAATRGWLERMLQKHPTDRPPAAGAAARWLREASASPMEPGHALAEVASADAARHAPSSAGTFRISLLEPAASDGGASPDEPEDAVAPPAPSTQRAAPTLDDWRHVRRGDVARPARDPSVLHTRGVPVLGRDELKNTLWRQLGEVHATGEGRIVELVGQDDDGASELAAWMVDTAHRSGAVGVERTATQSSRFETTLIVLDDAPRHPQALDAALRLVDAGCATLVLLATRRDVRARAEGYQRTLVGRMHPCLIVPSLAPAMLARRLTSVLSLAPAFAGALARRVGGHTGLARAAILHWHRQGLLFPQPDGIALRDGLDVSEAPLPPEPSGHLADLEDPVLRGLELLALAAGPVRHELWSRVLADQALPPPLAVASTWWHLGRIERRGDLWHLHSPTLEAELVQSARAAGREHDALRAWLRVWRGGDPKRVAQLELRLGRHQHAFPPLLAAARRLALDAPSGEAARLVMQLRRSAEARHLDDDHPERVALQMLAAALKGEPLAKLSAMRDRVDRFGDEHDRAWLRVLMAAATGSTDHAAARAFLDHATSVGARSYVGAFAHERLAMNAVWRRETDRRRRMADATSAWQAQGDRGRALHLEATALMVAGKAEAACERAGTALAQDLSSWPELEMRAATQWGWLKEELGDDDDARRAYERAVRTGSGEGREAPALLGLARLDLWNGHLTALETVRRTAHRLQDPMHLLSAILLGLVDDTVSIDQVRERIPRTRVVTGHLRCLERIRSLRESLGRPTGPLDAVGHELRAALEG